MSTDSASTTSLLNNLRQRVSWPTMRTILGHYDLPTGQGWKKTIQKLLAYSELGLEQANKINALEDAYLEHLLVGEKSIKIFSLEEDIAKELFQFLKTFQPPENDFTNHYPYPLPDEKLAEADSSPHLVKVENIDGGSSIALVFCTKRFIVERKELDIDEFSEEMIEELKGYDEIIAVKRHMRQFFDVVKINSENNTVKVLIDTSGGISSDDQILASYQIMRFFNEFIKDSGVSDLILGEPENLYPLLKKLYNNGEEGRICEIAFITDEASIKQERMRRKDTDLRTETYHKAGREAVPQITPYRLGVCWTFPLSGETSSKPELMLAGKLATLSDKQQRLSSAIITNCTGLEDYNFVMQKIHRHLNEPAEQNQDSQ